MSRTIALLYEGAFLTSVADANRIREGWINQAAEAIAQAVFDFIRPQFVKATPSLKGPAVVFDGKVYPAQLIDGATWTPVRAVSEAAGLRVEYDSTAHITTLRR